MLTQVILFWLLNITISPYPKKASVINSANRSSGFCVLELLRPSGMYSAHANMYRCASRPNVSRKIPCCTIFHKIVASDCAAMPYALQARNCDANPSVVPVRPPRLCPNGATLHSPQRRAALAQRLQRHGVGSLWRNGILYTDRPRPPKTPDPFALTSRSAPASTSAPAPSSPALRPRSPSSVSSRASHALRSP